HRKRGKDRAVDAHHPRRRFDEARQARASRHRGLTHPHPRALRMALAADDWVALGEVARPHGVRGEVRVRLYNPDSDLLLEADEVLVRLKEGDEHEVSVDGARR